MSCVHARFLTLFLMAVVLPNAGAVEAQIPWDDPESLSKNYLLLTHPRTSGQNMFTHTIWDMTRDTVAAEVEGGGGMPWFILPGHPGVVLHADVGPTGLPESRFGVARGNWLRKIGSPLRLPRMTIKPSPIHAEKELNVGANRLPGPFLSRDLVRVLYFKDGDLWIGDVDWGGGTVYQRRQVTRVGLFESGRPVLHWHADQVFLEGGFSQERPIVRVDLEAGDVEELPRGYVFGPGAMFANPTGRYLCTSMGELLACYDVEEARSFRVSLLPVLDESRIPRALRRGELFMRPAHDKEHGANVVWIDEDRALSWTTGVVGMVDLAAETSRVVYAPEFPAGSRDGIFEVGLLPGAEHALITIAKYEGRDLYFDLMRLSLTDGSLVELPSLEAAPGSRTPVLRWLDPARFIVALREGGLTEIGTWLHDLESGDSHRICAAPAVIDPILPVGGVMTGSAEGLGEVAYFYSRARGGGVFRARLSDASCEMVSTGSADRVSTIRPFLVLPPGYVAPRAAASLGGSSTPGQ